METQLLANMLDSQQIMNSASSLHDNQQQQQKLDSVANQFMDMSQSNIPMSQLMGGGNNNDHHHHDQDDNQDLNENDHENENENENDNSNSNGNNMQDENSNGQLNANSDGMGGMQSIYKKF